MELKQNFSILDLCTKPSSFHVSTKSLHLSHLALTIPSRTSNRRAWRGKCRPLSGRPSGWPRRTGKGSGRRARTACMLEAGLSLLVANGFGLIWRGELRVPGGRA
jgi:hypothetical protein